MRRRNPTGPLLKAAGCSVDAGQTSKTSCNIEKKRPTVKMLHINVKEQFSRPSFTDLPAELLDAIFEELPRQRDLVSLARTCRFMSRAVENQLYKEVTIYSAKELSLLHQSIRAKPSRAQLVRSFSIERGLRERDWYRANQTMPRSGELSDYFLLPELERLRSLHLNSFYMNQAEWNGLLVQAACGQVLCSLKTCTLRFQHPTGDRVGGHVFETVFMHPTLERLVIYNLDYGLPPHNNPRTALQRLELHSSGLSVVGLRRMFQTAASLKEFVLRSGPPEPFKVSVEEFSDFSEALEVVGPTLEKLVMTKPAGTARRPMRMRNMVALRHLAIDVDSWLGWVCDNLDAAKEDLMSELLPPKLEVLEACGWACKFDSFVDEPLVEALGPVFKDKASLAPLLKRICLPGKGGCGEVSPALSAACFDADILVTQDESTTLPAREILDRKVDRMPQHLQRVYRESWLSELTGETSNR